MWVLLAIFKGFMLVLCVQGYNIQLRPGYWNCPSKPEIELDFSAVETKILALKSGTRQAGKNTDFFYVCVGPI